MQENRPQSFRSFLHQQGYASDDEGEGTTRVANARRPASGQKTVQEFKLGIITMLVVTLVLVTIFWGRDAKRTDAPVLRHSAGDLIRRYPQPVDPASPADDNPTARQPAPSPGPTDPPQDAAPPPQPKTIAPPARTYKVRRGDTLGAICARYYGSSVHWKKIAKLNNVRRPEALRVGQPLKLPVNLLGEARRSTPLRAKDRPRTASPSRRPRSAPPHRRAPSQDPYEIFGGRQSI